MNYIEKLLATLTMGTTSSTAVQSLGKIEERAPAVCAKTLCFFSRSDKAGCAFDRVHSSNDHCVAVYGSILILFLAVEILQSVNNRTQTLREILRMVTIEILINSFSTD